MAASATNWIALNRNELATISYDADSVMRNGKIAKVWVTLAFNKPTIRPGYTVPLTKQVSRWIFNCADRTEAIGTSLSYTSEHDVHSTPGEPNNFEDVAPDTIFEAVMKAACAK
jgi:hypothetical protein